MAQTLVNLFIHVVFSTKSRLPMIEPEIEDELYAYIGGIANGYDSKLIIGNGTANHVHLLLSLDKNVPVPVIVGKIKRDSSKWIKMKGINNSKFGWQDGYAAFSVGHKQIDDVTHYIRKQKDHHQQKVFEDEMRGFFRKYEIPYDEKYVWD